MMKKLLIAVLLTMGLMTHAANLAEAQTLDTKPGYRVGDEDPDRLAGEDGSASRDRELGPGQPGHTEITGEHEPNPQFESYRRPQPSPYDALVEEVETETGAVNGGWLPSGHDCPCGPDCKCPDPSVCKNGDCKKNYVIFFTADWCRACQRMYPRIKELRDAGYIVYVFNIDKFKPAAEKFQIESLPTTVVMDQGKEVARFIGVVEKSKITNVTKTRDEQATADPTTDYDLR
jgi:thiol-disulfide isomerase/thioredoxin